MTIPLLTKFLKIHSRYVICFAALNQLIKLKTNSMKTKKILFSLCILASVTASAQKGNWYVGGNVGFNLSQTKHENGNITLDDGKRTSWTFAPEIGTFITDQTQVGIALMIVGSKFDDQDSPVSTINKGTSYGGNIYGRRFFGKEAFKPFVGVNVGYITGDSKTTFGNVTTEGPDNSVFNANINGGFGYAISKRFTTVGSFGFLGYQNNTTKSGSNKTTTSSFGLDANSLGNRFTIGFYYTL